MLDLAGLEPGHRVLDVAAGTGEQTLIAARRVGPYGFVLATDIAGTGEQTLIAARRVGPYGFVLATDIADRMLACLDEAARSEGPTNVGTRVMDARLPELEPESF
jgi:ubiquinone/menaquinone biosynthesis C-methylase UbiE